MASKPTSYVRDVDSLPEVAMATLNIGLQKTGKRACQCGNGACVHGGKDVARKTGQAVPANGPGEWVPCFVTVPDTRDRRFTRQRHY